MSAVPSQINILLVDDRNENLIALESLLQADDTKIFKAHSGREALSLLLDNEFAVALLDVQMPEINGFELAELMRGKQKTRSIPIIFVTAGAIDAKYTFMGYEAGAVDFLYKPLDPRVVRSKVRVFLELERQRLLIRSQVDQLSKALRTREEFLSIASHELKTPITSMQLQVQSVRRLLKPESKQAPTPERLTRMLDLTASQLNKLTRLIDELLDVSRIEAGRLLIEAKDTDLSALVIEVIERFRGELEAAKCSLSLDVGQNIRASCDPFRTEQVLINLITNLLKYAPGAPVSVSLRQEEGIARLRVADQGIGIPESKLSTVFERFERTREHRGVSGLGLGMYIARQIMLGQRGDIRVESQEGVGTTFTADFAPATT